MSRPGSPRSNGPPAAPAQGGAHDDATIGVIMLDTAFARLPGDVANPATWRYPVRLRVVRGVTPRDVIEGDPRSAIAAFREAIDDLVAQGVAGVTTSCGFLAAIHQELRRHCPVPLATSSLMQIPMALAALPAGRTVGVLVSDKAAMRDRHFLGVGAPTGLPLAELPYDGALRTHMREGRAKADPEAQEREAVAVVARLLEEHPDVGAIVSECANLPPHSAAIARTFGLPVFDVVTLVDWLRAAIRPRHFARAAQP